MTFHGIIHNCSLKQSDTPNTAHENLNKNTALE